jgi:hypothetical protein
MKEFQKGRKMNKSTIQKARQTNLAEYLKSAGIPLDISGSRHRHKEHDSLVFTKNMYYRNSRQEYGNAIDYLVKHMGMDFKQAVNELTDAPIIADKIKQSSGFALDCKSLNYNQDKVKDYLYKTRHIAQNVIDYFIENKLLFQEKRANNAVFPIYDEHDNCAGAELQGIQQKKFKGMKAGSKYGYGFNMRFSNDNTYDYVMFFESAIDLMSFVDYKRNLDKKSLDRCILISMPGLKLNIIQHSKTAFKGNLNAVLCVDNDKAGEMFKTAVNSAGIDFIECSPDQKFKDWNEQISAVRGSVPMKRAMERGRGF